MSEKLEEPQSDEEYKRRAEEFQKNANEIIGGMTGWICPRCGRGNSPFASSCPCVPMPPMYPSCISNPGA